MKIVVKYLYVWIMVVLSIMFVSCNFIIGNNPSDPTTEQNNGSDTHFTVTVLSADTAMGDVTGGGVYELGMLVELTATPKRNYSFKCWSDGVGDNPRYINVTSDITYTAEFYDPYNGHDYVDLGLPNGAKWATCNVGAESPEEYGYYFAWGEVVPKKKFTWATYKFMATGYDSWEGITKYTYNAFDNDGNSAIWYDMKGNFIGDNKTILEPEDDAATVYMGGDWEMPLDGDIGELIEYCNWEWTDNYNSTNVAGYIVKSKVNDNHIFLPAAGTYFDSDLNEIGTSGTYWSNSIGDWSCRYASYFYFFEGVVRDYFVVRHVGHTIRGVCHN